MAFATTLYVFLKFFLWRKKFCGYSTEPKDANP